MNISSKIIVFSILATLIPAVGLGILSFQQNETMISENVTRELRALANYAGRESDLWIKEQILIARDLSTSISTSKILIEELSLENQSQENISVAHQGALELYLKSVHSRLEDVLELTVVDVEGGIVASNVAIPFSVTLSQDWPEDASIQGDVVISPEWNENYATAILSVSVPILSIDDYILGALIVTFDMRSIRSSLKDKVKSPPGEVLLLDKAGNIMLASDAGILNTNESKLFDSGMMNRLQEKPGEYEIFLGPQQEKVVGLAYESEKPSVTIIALRNYQSVYSAWEQQRDLFAGLIGIMILVVAAIALRMSHAIVTPLQKLISATEKIVKGDLNVKLVNAQHDEIGQLTQRFNQMTDKLRQNQVEINAASDAMQKKNQLLETLSVTDSLTGLYNRNKLNMIISDQLARYERNKRPFAALMIDVDYFKTLNDNLGHIAGDEVIAAIAKKISQSIRNVDFAARYGGDEFIIILTETSVNEAVKTAERIRAQVASVHCSSLNKTLKVTLSIGIIQSEPEDLSLTMLLSRVDSALYQAKRSGRNQVHCATPIPKVKQQHS
ncbi:MAG: diguanylate cyclase [Nitrosomonas sp.]|uniref:diguanylate cyclase n=1 Tax=Nitrosomonas sp. TaxID=42353 RepID=UPI0025F7283A|nr:diguanylate cyclase [Nitrosomonas sp.]MBY0474180.1 diguanylate cyclase [Nitrosomonas sp.]